ncbi:vigilin [Ischnura elegans]|uniref:vigilin n=1 Tax=Ischnura elegans TaxID=197161 RepID=UPI001ED88DC7|nr:vigilin [Ischnura elegans]
MQEPMAAISMKTGVSGGEGEAYEPQSYDEVFPALPESAGLPEANGGGTGAMRIGTSVVTQVFMVPYNERKLYSNEGFGEGNGVRICLDIMRETGAVIETSSGKDHSLTFLVTGKQNEVLEARRKILANFQMQMVGEVSIPKEHHRCILGAKAVRLKELEKNTATKINVPSIADPSDVITVTGTREGIDKAIHEIKVISDEQSKQAYERVSIPKKYHPFIAGAHNEKVSALMAETGVRVNIPPLTVQKDELTIAGEKEGVLIAKERILAIYQEMEKKCTTISLEVAKAQHRYVIGPKGNTIAEILQETGVSVEMPPSESSVGTIILRGPQEKLGHALCMVYEKANSVRSVYVNAPAWIHKYIIGRKGEEIRRITQNFPKVHVEFTEKDERIKIEGPPEEVEAAQKALEAKVDDLVSRLVFDEITVDPKFYKHIIGKSGANVNRMKEETGVTINIGEKNGNNYIRIEGDKAGVAKAKKELEDMVHKLENEKEKDLIIDQRYYKSIIGTKGEKIREVREKFNQVQIMFPSLGDKRDVVTIRGPREDVDKCSQHLMKLVKELSENSYSQDVPIYKQFHKFIIGKRGANIQKIRDETHTKIELPAEGVENDVITITGKKENVEEARKRIQKIQNELANIVTEEISIPPRYYHSIIGPRGKLINSIMEDCGGVTIKFPSSESNNDNVVIRGPKEDVEKAKQLLKEMSNERQQTCNCAEVRAKAKHHRYLIGRNGARIKKLRDSTGARIVFPTEKDEDKEIITILGTKEAVEKAKAELEATIADMDNVVEVEMKVDPKHHRHFVARRGEVLSQISEQFGDVRISFPRSGNMSDKVTLKGAKECIEGAKARILEIVDELDSMVTIECIIPQKHHRSVMGAKGRHVQNITSEFEVQIKFPDRDMQDHSNQQFNQQPQPQQSAQWQATPQWSSGANQDAWATPMPQDQWATPAPQEEWGTNTNQEQWPTDAQHHADQWSTGMQPAAWEPSNPLNGEGVLPVVDQVKANDGSQVPEPHSTMNQVDAIAPEEPAGPRPCDIIRITGKKENCEGAKEALLALVPITIEVNVPFDYHRLIIGQKGRAVREMRDKYDVNIVLSPAEKKLDIITISGSPASVEQAKEAIEEKCRQLDEEKKEKALQSFELKIEVDPNYHPKIIGKKGAVINKIRTKHNVQINFPKKGDPEEHIITIIGYENAATAARDDIMKIVNTLNEMAKEEVNIDPRVHSRLIGARGRNIHKIMEMFSVEIKFPRPTASPEEAGIVTITGSEEAVMDAKDHLLNLEEEYLQDIGDFNRSEQTTSWSFPEPSSGGGGSGGSNSGDAVSTNAGSSGGNSGASAAAPGFFVKGAPWEQQKGNQESPAVAMQAPDTASTEEFPSFGGPVSPLVTPSPWGPRR